MPEEKIIKTVKQYGGPVSEAEMAKLIEIGRGYRAVKQAVYGRYGGIRSIGKLYPGYTIQNEMTDSGLRQRLELPSVYFYLAVFEALGDLKSQWSDLKNRISRRILEHEGFDDEEKHYLRYVLKMDPCLDAVLNRRPYKLPAAFRSLELHRLDQYIRRQTRKYKKRLHASEEDGFQISERAYRYGDGGIYLTTKAKRQRIFVRLTDNNRYEKQLYIRLLPKDNRLELHVPVEIRKRKHPAYQQTVGIVLGYDTMLTTASGHCYGEELGRLVYREAQRLRNVSRKRNALRRRLRELEQQDKKAERIRRCNLGTQKLSAQHKRYGSFIESYINRELNRMLKAEKPKEIYLCVPAVRLTGTADKRLRFSLTIWKRGYIRERLLFKCRANSIRVVEVSRAGTQAGYTAAVDTGALEHCVNDTDQRINNRESWDLIQGTLRRREPLTM